MTVLVILITQHLMNLEKHLITFHKNKFINKLNSLFFFAYTQFIF